MILKEFYIIDLNEQMARKDVFSEGVNIITSSENGAGKSSLLKSIYYALGLEIKQFKSGWDPTKMLFVLKYKKDSKSKEGLIARYGNTFYVGDINNGLLIKTAQEYSDWLTTELLGINILLKGKQNNYQSIYASSLLGLFYVDQDTSWNGGVFKKTTQVTGMHGRDAYPKEVMEYCLSLKDKKHITFKTRIEKNIRRRQVIIEEETWLEKISEKLIKDRKDIYYDGFDESSIKKQINGFIKDLEKLDSKISDYANKIYVEQIKLDGMLLEQRELLDIRDASESSYTQHSKIRCKTCKHILDDHNIDDRIILSSNIFTLNSMISGLEADILKVKDKIKALSSEELFSKTKYQDLVNKLQKEKAYNNVEEFINYQADNALLNRKGLRLQQLSYKRTRVENVIGALEQRSKELLKRQSKQRSKIKSGYDEYKEEFSSELSLELLNNDLDFLEFKNLKSSGSEEIELYVLYYAIYWKLLNEYGRIKIPFGLDTLIKDDVSSTTLEKRYKFIEDNLLSLDEQIFFVILSDKLVLLKNLESYNCITINKPVDNKMKWILSRDEFKKDDIKSLINLIESAE